LRPNETDNLAAPRLFRKYAHQRVRLTACISFVNMKGKEFNGPSRSTGASHWPDSQGNRIQAFNSDCRPF
jgi:hypothetical protein